MKRLLLVDDDALVTRAYRDRLSAHGFQVNTAPDGMAAINILRSAKPDLVVLDLMMPNLSGVEVLKFIRADKRLATTPVIVLTNAYMNELGREAAAIGIERALLKTQCSPSVLMSVVDELLESKPPPEELTEPGSEAQVSATQQLTPPAPAPQPPKASSRGPAQDFLARGPGICADLRKSFQALSREPRPQPGQEGKWQDFYRKLHSLAATAGSTPYHQITQMVTVFEALLYTLIENPARLSPSVLRTVANLIDFLELLFQNAAKTQPAPAHTPQALVVDDDAVSNGLVAGALKQAQIEAYAVEDPLKAWDHVQKKHYDLLLLDIEMPGLDGFELCKRVRGLPAYAKTPVIFVTGHSDFTHRAKGTLSGGDDLIAKPILPMEMAAKAVMHMLKRQMAA